MLRLAVVFAAALSLLAQTGQITGHVSDPTGATIPGASVTVTNIGTEVVTQTTTNADGYYAVPFLSPGDYRISVGKEGFKTASRSPVKLDVDQIARIDFGLTLGAQTEQVVVTSSAAPLVQTETAALGQVIGERTSGGPAARVSISTVKSFMYFTSRRNAA